MRTSLIAGNWKMHGSRDANSRLIGGLLDGYDVRGGCDILVCPPFPYLAEVARLLNGSGILMGAQNCSTEESGAYTGEVAASMLGETGCKYVIVGHSERREIFGETDSTVARKFVAVQQAQLEPILCVGETLAQRDADETRLVIERQVNAVLDVAGVAAFARAVIAYEPVWAIGTGKTASPEQAQAVHALIRGMIAAKDDKIAGSIRLLYGGSVKAANAAQLLAMPDIDGGLIGGASLQAEEFLRICAAAKA
ncbi:MAG: triose-phosphate isomerase [Chromatiales bacterium]|jgi:triosephosphate isomerase|nr:triose-phosphate isomerase [Chromatiales bacterium]PLX54860.1 MAG: triose-phosphate isomerase [Chromatiales bacterium]